MRKIIFILCVPFISGCRNTEPAEETPDTAVSPVVVIDSTTTIGKKDDSIPQISGSCEKGREVGNLEQYSIKMKVGSSESDSISVRSDASCFNLEGCDHNILGKIKSGTIIYAQGPLKNSDFSAGLAYAFPVKDRNGNVCRGYLSYLNVEEMEAARNK